MLAVYGVLLLAFTALFFIWAHGQFRRPAPKKWTTWESTSVVVALTVIGLLSFGIGLILKAAAGFASNPISLFQAAMVAVIVAGSVFLGRALRRLSLSYGTEQPGDVPAPSGDGPAPANDTGSGDGPRPIRGPGRRAA